MAEAAPSFVHLRVRSAYSLLDGAMHVKAIVGAAAKGGMPAVAITDTANLFGALEFSEAAAEKGVQPVLGMSVSLRRDDAAAPDEVWRDAIALYAKDEAGWANLMALSSEAWLDAPQGSTPHITLSQLAARADGLIALTGGWEGPVDALLRDGKRDEAGDLVDALGALFPDRLYVELQRIGAPQEAEVEAALLDMAYDRALPIVATNDVRFADRSRFASHEVLLAIAEGATIGDEERRRATPECGFKSAPEMAALFADLPEALANTVEIARRCSVRARTRAPILPRFSGEHGRDEPAELAAQARAGLEERLRRREPAASPDAYAARLELEIDVISRMGFAGYFLIVADFIKWAKQQGIPVGPGRGSGAGSLVAYALTITDLDPLRFGLLFERFLNPERVSMPDFDIDFCQDRRGEVIDYVRDRYGADRVAQIITFGTLQARAALRDVGRVLQAPFPQVDRLAKLVPNNPAAPVTLAQAVDGEPKLQEARAREPEVAAILDHAMALEGLYRNASTHAAGVVIGDRPLVELTPLYRDPRGEMPATQYNMKWVEPAGLVKFDFLGLKTLTVIERALAFIRQGGVEVDFDRIGFDDPATYALLASGATMGVFQLESSGMRDTLRRMRADTLEDIIALISLYRPGPMKNIETYCDVKFGRREPDYLHPSLEPILKETYGVIIYQEQVMQIAQVLSGYSLGEADLLRRAMGKKKKDEMDRQKARFIEGATANGVAADTADRIFELVAEFAGYGFNKSHAAAYAVIAYQTAWLKANHPVAFLAASMSLDIDDTDKLGAFVQEARRMGVKVLAPCMNGSEADFSVDGDAIRYALGAVRNVGLAAMKAVTAQRPKGGFADLFDLIERIDPKTLNRRTLENLARAGALDALEPDRARAFAAAEVVCAHGQRHAGEQASSQVSLFAAAPGEIRRPPLPAARSWSAQERLDNEFAALGLYLSGHPLSDIADALRRNQTVFINEAADRAQDGAGMFRMAGIVRSRKERMSNQGTGKFAWVSFSDPTGEFEAFVAPEVLSQFRDLLEPGRAVTFRAKARASDGELKLSADQIEALETASHLGACRGLKVFVARGASAEPAAAALRAVAGQAQQKAAPVGELMLVIQTETGGEVVLRAPGRWPVGLAARQALKGAPGVAAVADYL